MADKYTVVMDFGYKYIIVKQDPHNGDMAFFGGFYNEVDCVGTEDECQCWENESWANTERDAVKFESFAEAKATFDNLEDNANCNVVLYGKGDRQNFGGTEWYPLKTFKV